MKDNIDSICPSEAIIVVPEFVPSSLHFNTILQVEYDLVPDLCGPERTWKKKNDNLQTLEAVIYEPPHDKTNHPPSDQSLRCPLECTAKSDQTGRIPGWSESSLGAQSLCWFCHVAAHILYTVYMYMYLTQKRNFWNSNTEIALQMDQDLSGLENMILL